MLSRRAYLRHKDRQRLQKEEDRKVIAELHARLKQLEVERGELERRVELLQKVLRSEEGFAVDQSVQTSRRPL